MADLTKTITVAGEDITLSLLVWRFLKIKPEGYVERVLDMNPGIADIGQFLVVGSRVVLPLDYESQAATQPVITLWD